VFFCEVRRVVLPVARTRWAERTFLHTHPRGPQGPNLEVVAPLGYPHSSYSKSIPKRNILTVSFRFYSTVSIFSHPSSPIFHTHTNCLLRAPFVILFLSLLHLHPSNSFSLSSPWRVRLHPLPQVAATAPGRTPCSGGRPAPSTAATAGGRDGSRRATTSSVASRAPALRGSPSSRPSGRSRQRRRPPASPSLRHDLVLQAACGGSVYALQQYSGHTGAR
jgi:hypothetical protein